MREKIKMKNYSDYYFNKIKREFIEKEYRRKHRNKCDKDHDAYLENLIDNLNLLGENRKEIEWIMKDGVWKEENSLNKIKLCDLLIGYYDGHAIPIELKGSKKQFLSAKKQVTSGKNFLENELGLFVPYGKIVVFDKGFYETYIYDFDSKKRYNLFTKTDFKKMCSIRNLKE
jgi:hypothetical protein